MKTAYVFAGQGAQYPGMGADLYEKYEESRVVFEEAGEYVKNLCFSGTAEELKETQNTQPCVYAVTMAAYNAFKARLAAELGEGSEAEPAAMAGFSLGEYSALTAAGIVKEISTGVELMENRGRWMGEAGRDEEGNGMGTMAAAIGDRQKVIDCVEAVREDGILVAANMNAPTQTVVSGDKAAVARFAEAAKEIKLRVTPLAVGSAFHSPMMEPASGKMNDLIMSKELGEASVPVYSNLTARPLSEYRKEGGSIEEAQSTADIADAMAKQLMSPVQWVDIVQELIAQGFDTFVEFGPGKTLCGLIKKTDRSVNTFNVENCETMDAAIEGLKALMQNQEQ